MTIDLGLRFIARNSEGTQNKMYVDDLTSYTENDVSLGFVITLGDTIVYQDSVGTFSLNGKNQTLEVSAPTTDGFPTNGTYTVYVRIQDNETLDITTGTKSFVLDYTAPTNLLSIVVDGYSSTITDRDSYDYANLTVNSYELRHVDPNAVESTSATQTLLISPTIYAGTHTLYLTADVTWDGTDVSLNDYVTHSTTAVAYKLDEDTIMDAVDALKESYRVNLQVNRSEARNQKVLIDEIDIYEDDYWLGIRRNDSLTSYLSLLKIYDILNEDLVASGEIIPYSTHESRISYLETFPIQEGVAIDIDRTNPLAPVINVDSDEEFDNISTRPLQNKVIGNVLTKSKDYTGFVDPDNVIVTYDIGTRKVTLTGSVEFYWHGRRIAEIVDGWVSPAHADVPGIYFLKYNGNGVEFNTDPWNFYCGQICYLQYKQGALGLDTIGLRESHGMGDWNWHEGQHYAIGTMLRSGGDLSGYILNSPTAANRRPNIATTYLKDEDLGSALPSLTSKKYTQRSLSGAGVRTFTLNQDDIIANNGTLPYYNQWNGVAWVQTLMSNNQFGAIFVVALPASADSQSQQYRYLWVQPQQVGTLAAIQALTPLNLTHGETPTLVSEFVFIAKVIIQVTGGTWRLYSVEKLTGSRAIQVSSPSGSYLSVINRDDSLVGNGTTIEPLGHNPADTTITGLKSDAGVGGEVPATLYNWFKSVYASLVDSSVKSWIVGIATYLKSIADRVGLLEDKYILKYVVPQDSLIVNLTLDKYGNALLFSEGDIIEITYLIPEFTGGISARADVAFNERTDLIYKMSNNTTRSAILTGTTNYPSQRTTVIARLQANEIRGEVFATVLTPNIVGIYYTYYSDGLNSTTISSIQIRCVTPGVPKNTVIIIKKI